MDEMAVSKFKARCLAEVERVRRTGRALTITKHGEPVAKLVPVPPRPASESGFGCMKDLTTFVGDVVSPLPPEMWEVLRD